jgi:aspartyl protease family protein
VKVGTIERRRLAVHISAAFGEMNVLGMNFLSSLSGWGVEGRWLVLKP